MKQLPLFAPPIQRRNRRPEPLSLYLAVLTLRRRGIRVIRAGRQAHLIDGRRIVSAKYVIALARAAKG